MAVVGFTSYGDGHARAHWPLHLAREPCGRTGHAACFVPQQSLCDCRARHRAHLYELARIQRLFPAVLSDCLWRQNVQFGLVIGPFDDWHCHFGPRQWSDCCAHRTL